MKKILAIFLIFLAFSHTQAQKLEVVFCADFSGSTNGMVKELQNSVWASINQIENEYPSLEVDYGLVGFGRKSFNKENNYSEVINPLGTPINDIGYSLVKLLEVIQSCEAYPQKAMNDCVKGIKWSKDDNVKKLLFFIGNGGIPMKQMEVELKKAKKIGIDVVPIYFKRNPSYKTGKESWEAFAKHLNKDLIIALPNQTKIQFKKYYDETFIRDSGAKLAGTYLGYGSRGRLAVKHLKTMVEELQNSSLENYEEMLIYQSSKSVQGSNKGWDLVDLFASGTFDFNKLSKSDIPVFLQGFNEEQFKKYLALKLKERNLIVSKLRLELSKRNEFIHRRQLKSQHFEGKGGLNIIISGKILNSVSDSQILVAN